MKRKGKIHTSPSSRNAADDPAEIAEEINRWMARWAQLFKQWNELSEEQRATAKKLFLGQLPHLPEWMRDEAEKFLEERGWGKFPPGDANL